MTGKIIEELKSGYITFPKVFLTNYKDLGISDKEFIFLIYLMQNNEFDPQRIANDLNMETFEVLELVSSLTGKDVLKLESIDDGKSIEERFSLEELYNKLALKFIGENEKKDDDSSNIYDQFEKEFGRTLSPMEYQIIGAWLDDGFLEETILLALKEATFNGITNLRYIDKILFEWRKKGIKTKDDVLAQKKQFQKKKEVKKEVFDYDWLNE